MAGLGDDLSGLCEQHESDWNEECESGGEGDHLGHVKFPEWCVALCSDLEMPAAPKSDAA